MKFESKFGIGEIVTTKQRVRDDGATYQDALFRVVCVQFDLARHTSYICREPMQGLMTSFLEPELSGDPFFNQELGCYPEQAE